MRDLVYEGVQLTRPQKVSAIERSSFFCTVLVKERQAKKRADIALPVTIPRERGRKEAPL